jgi:peptide/nickel transport system substrate-binding protein
MMAAILSNRGEVVPDHPISSAYRFFSSLPSRGRDIEKAKSLLKEAGYGGGLQFKLYAASSPAIREKIAIILKEMARPAGIDIQVEVVGYDRYLSQIWNKGVPYIGFYGTRPTADAILMKLYSKEFGIDEGRWAASHPDQVNLLVKAREVVDFEKRKQLYAQFLKASRDEGPFVIPFARSELSAKRDYVKDYLINPSVFEVDLEDVWLTDAAPKKKA